MGWNPAKFFVGGYRHNTVTTGIGLCAGWPSKAV
jgi:hypothetical protein